MWIFDVCVPDCAYLSACVTCFSICLCIFFLHLNLFFFFSTPTWIHTLYCTCCWILKPALGTEQNVWLTSSVLSQSLSGELWSQDFQMDLGAGWLMHHSWPGFSQGPYLGQLSSRPRPGPAPEGTMLFRLPWKCVFSFPQGSLSLYFCDIFLTCNCFFKKSCLYTHHPPYRHVIHCHLSVHCCLHPLMVIDVRHCLPWGPLSTIYTHGMPY